MYTQSTLSLTSTRKCAYIIFTLTSFSTFQMTLKQNRKTGRKCQKLRIGSQCWVIVYWLASGTACIRYTVVKTQLQSVYQQRTLQIDRRQQSSWLNIAKLYIEPLYTVTNQCDHNQNLTAVTAYYLVLYLLCASIEQYK